MATHIINKFDFATICAGVLRLIEKPDLYQKYKKFLDSEFFFYGDTSKNARSLRKLIDLLKEIDTDRSGEYAGGRARGLSIQNVDSCIHHFLPDSELKISVIELFSYMRRDDDLKAKAADIECFRVFTDYLKTLRIAKHAAPMFKEYQEGKADDAAAYLSNMLSEINAIKDPSVYSFDPERNYEDVMVGKDLGYIQDILNLGCAHIDSELGGFETQTLNVFISTPNGGKSTMCHHIIVQCFKAKKKVHVTCVEDRPKSFLSKLTAAWTGIEVRRLRKEFNNLTTQEKEQIQELKKLMKLYLKVDFVYGQNVDLIHRSKLEYDLECKVNGWTVPVVDVIDYTGHIAGRSDGDKMYEKMRTAYAARKDFALANNKIAFDFAQVNREGSKRMKGNEVLTMADLAGSFDIAQVCDNIISINRDLLDRMSHKAILHICKARDGDVGGSFQVGTKFHIAQYDMDDCTWINAEKDYVKSMLADKAI